MLLWDDMECHNVLWKLPENKIFWIVVNIYVNMCGIDEQNSDDLIHLEMNDPTKCITISSFNFPSLLSIKWYEQWP